MATKALNYKTEEINQRLNLAGEAAQTSAANQADIAGLKSKTDSISKQSTESEEQALVFTTDGGVQVGKIDANGADFANLKRGGQQVARMSDLPTVPTLDTSIGRNPSNSHTPSSKAVKAYVDAKQIDLPITKESTQSEAEEMEFTNDAGTQSYAKLGDYGVKAKAYLDMQGNSVIPTKDIAIGDTPSQTNVPTSKAVADYVAAHGAGNLPIDREAAPSNEEQLLLATDRGKVVTSIDGEIKNGIEDELLLTDDDVNEDDIDINKILLRIFQKKIYAHDFIDIKTGKSLKITQNKPYFDDSQFIPDMTSKGIEMRSKTLFYDGDTKSSQDFICNAVVYPNGEIIAARPGKIVKIAADGVETPLLTITGSGDWRCLYMDKDFNVYASPHASMGGAGGFSMTDRGLYKLAYGETTFVKVISLYDISSDVETETQSNDDAIWTMCQDNKGYLYAGVYAHTVRPNPAIYRSTDGGDTWVYLFNFRSSGIAPSGMHIHCIIYNQFDDKLYSIVGEVNEIYCSADNGTTWQPMNVRLEDGKGTTLIAVKDGIIAGSDTAYSAIMSKIYSNGTCKTSGRMWANTVFALRRSDLTGWIYAFTKIDSSVDNTDYMPPIEAVDDVNALQLWIESNPRNLAGWQKMHNNTKDYYPDDCIRPQHCAILRSCDDGETWEIVYKKLVPSDRVGFPTTGFFMNGECLTGLINKVNNSYKFVNPVIISEGKHRFGVGGIDISYEIFSKTMLSNIINII